MPTLAPDLDITLSELHSASATLFGVGLAEVTRDMLHETLTFQLRLYKYPVTRHGVNYAVAGRILGDNEAIARQTSHNLAIVAADHILADMFDHA